MYSKLIIKKKIKSFNKEILVDGDKSLSIRWALLASQARGISRSTNLLMSEDVINTLKCLKKLGVKSKHSKKNCTIYGVGLNGFNYKNSLTLNAGNSGTLARLIMGLLIHNKKKIKIIGDKSLSKRDFLRVIEPLKKFGANFESNLGRLPVTITGTQVSSPIKYFEKRGSAQCKSAIIMGALNTKGRTYIKAKKSRNHTELLLKYLKLPIKVNRTKFYDYIKIDGRKKIPAFNYKIPSDISSCAFFIVLTALSHMNQN
jgi:3-phosphoshikimate 1-carboxyvinyltransferase